MYTIDQPGRPALTVPSLMLTTTGRKSGEKFIFPLFYGEIGDSYIVVASKGGAPKHPVWYLNILANPEVEVQVGTRKLQARACTATGEERARLWEKALEFWPPYADYQKKTELGGDPRGRARSRRLIRFRNDRMVSRMPRALDNIRVVDFSWVRAGPWATRWLGALGAEIIKIEWPETERGRLPSSTTPRHLKTNLNTSGNFADTNVNKKSLSLNVRTAEGSGDREAADRDFGHRD